MNCVMNHELDRKTTIVSNKRDDDGGLLELSSLVSTLSLEDVWRRRHPTNKSFTFKRNNSQSRLDYFLCSKVINNEIEQTYITPCLLSYHIFVEIKINTNRVERGLGLWILDKSDYSHLITHSGCHGDLKSSNSRVYPNGGKWLNTT